YRALQFSTAASVQIGRIRPDLRPFSWPFPATVVLPWAPPPPFPVRRTLNSSMSGPGEVPDSPTPAVRILHLEDSRVDHALVKFALQRSQLPNEITLVDTLDDFRRELASQRHDIVLADFHLPGFTGL